MDYDEIGENIYPPMRATVVVGHVLAEGEPVRALQPLGVHQPEGHRTPQLCRKVLDG